MNESLKDSAQNSNSTAKKDESPKPATSKPTATHPSTPLKSWLHKANAVTNEMSTNEQTRRAVAKRLS